MNPVLSPNQLEISTPTLMNHQKKAIAIAKIHNKYCFYWEMGIGKTRIGLEIMKLHGPIGLVICPLSIIQTAWLDDAAKFTPDLNIVSIWATSTPTRKKILQNAIDSKADIIVANYDTFKLLEPELMKLPIKTLWVDESAILKGRTTKIAKAVMRVSKKVPNVYLASGCPCPNSELEWFAQMNIVGPGLLGNSFYGYFRPVYFYQTGYMGYEWRIKNEMRKTLTNKISKKAWFLKKDECVDLPDKTFLPRQVFLSSNEWSAYSAMEEELLIELQGKEVFAANAMVKVMKLRELTSGFALTDKSEPLVFGQSKLNALLELLEELGDSKAVIWCHFKYEIELIRKQLEAPIGILSGDIPVKIREGYLRAWKEGELKYLICHPASAGHGLTLIEASHCIYFSLSHSLELFQQSQDRLHRIGQKNPVTYHLLFGVSPKGESSIDMAIYKALRSKDLSAKSILEGLKR